MNKIPEFPDSGKKVESNKAMGGSKPGSFKVTSAGKGHELTHDGGSIKDFETNDAPRVTKVSEPIASPPARKVSFGAP